jgi:hypothetical protein
MKSTLKSLSGTSFHMSTVKATLNELKQVLGEVHFTNDFEDKVQNEWLMELEDGSVFSVYDWKEYRSYDDNEVIEWHLGGFDKTTTERAKHQIINLLNETIK